MAIDFIVDFVIHIDKYLSILINNFGIFSYFILFLIIFLETGILITPFLPGDSLLFIAGAFAANRVFNIALLYFIFLIAAILGDSVNYWIGSFFGEKVFAKTRFFKKEHLERTRLFFQKHGGKTIIIARFVPIIRTFAPFIAGVGKMEYKRFFFYNVIGALLWVSIFVFAGYFFGRLDWVEKNLSLIIVFIIVASVIPIIIEVLRKKLGKR